MPDGTTLSIFMVAAAALLIIPGPSVIYIVTRSIDQGRIAGIVSALGVSIGTLGHITAAALGISAILVSSAFAFNIVKYLGAIYLVYLGVRTLLTRAEVRHPSEMKSQKLSKIFLEGIVVNLLNPKTALFFFAFLPQFVDVSRGAATAQIGILGGIFVVMALMSDSLYALLAGTTGRWLKSNLHFLRVQRYVTGSMYIALGVATAFSSSNRHK